DANLAAWRAAGRLGGETGELERSATPEEAVRGARTVLLPLPRSLDELDRLSRIVAAVADPGVVLLAGGRDKHMSPRMNAVLGAAF
ncbi:16S rRNA methyltransferase, partial [Xanthomonas citri pv. citri]|nr:16S rRNA methyltransferase [Xanthomonas citri pv. citri]